MAKRKILQESESYTFRSYCEMLAEPDEILGELGYALKIAQLSLPHSDRALPQLALAQQIQDILPLVSLSSETARREVLIAPIIFAVAIHCQSQIRIEYPLTVNNWLKGTLDYLLRSSQSLIVIKAKRDDLSRGFTQLAAEMIALAQAEDLESLYGAVTIGEAWRFGKLDAASKTITQDILLYSVPGQLEQLLKILVGIIEGNTCHD
ncbi:hypothetical protein [Prochlorothrix hollandica]|uniref:hypothetical protein n=1 Tax=Prochlorothrix hollandica TaxID=1223 RepID=UPI00333E9783